MSEGSTKPKPKPGSLVDVRTRVERLESDLRKNRTGIWLEVAEVQFDTKEPMTKVQLKGDRAHPKPTWWPVDPKAANAASDPEDDNAHDLYKAILNELDKKRVVLARLCAESESSELQCDALRFQSPDLGSRT